MKAHVKQDVCIGCGACIAICSPVFQFNDDGKAEAHNDKIDAMTEICTEKAASNCPVDAIVVS